MSIRVRYTIEDLEDLAVLFDQKSAAAASSSIRQDSTAKKLRDDREAQVWRTAAQIVRETTLVKR